MLLVFVLGPTNAGKSTLLDASRAFLEIGQVEVGKLMRAKYPPAHFQGQASPKHTQAEAWQMCMDGITVARAAGKQLCLIDGQPRDQEQLEKVQNLRHGIPGIYFLHLWAPADVREARARARDGHDPERLKLALSRVGNEPTVLYSILAQLHCTCARMSTHDTSLPDYRPEAILELVLRLNR